MANEVIVWLKGGPKDGKTLKYPVFNPGGLPNPIVFQGLFEGRWQTLEYRRIGRSNNYAFSGAKTCYADADV